jgi:LuxR family transcriptional regulator, maltose regulon positive regulatory protein
MHGATGRLTVVTAPAGWGKTTAVLEWRRRSARSRRFAWLGLDADDSDPARFWTCLVYAVDRALPGRVDDVVRLVAAGHKDMALRLVPHLVNALAASDDPLVLVLDDYQAVASEQVDAQLGFLVEHLPPSAHVVLISRSRPGLALSRLRAQGELTELTAGDLRFSPAETATLLTDVLDLRLPAKDVRALQRRTEGWAAALQLAALSLRRRGDPGAAIRAFTAHDEHLVDYLGAEVLAGLDQELRTFLLQTSVLGRMSASLCNAVTGRDDSVVMLRKVEQHNLFIVPLDDRRRWFRYHHLFADVLRLAACCLVAG